MHRQQKVLDILIGLLMTWLEDQFVKPEHRRGTDAVPTCSFADQAIKMFEGEAKNCGYTLDEEDKTYLLQQIERVDHEVRT